MNILAEFKALGERIKQSQKLIKTEEATKQACVVPFIKILGYDVYDPKEVVPEYIADVGIKKGEKVDYAILQDGKPIMLIECKQCGTDLDKQISQLYRYFSVTPTAKIAILTDGIIFKFYSDLEKANLMDLKPFLVLNLLNIEESLIPKIEKLSKPHFDLSTLLFSVSEQKYIREISLILFKQLAKPSDSFVKLFISQVYSGKVTQDVFEQFREIVKKSLQKIIMQIVAKEIDKRSKLQEDKKAVVVNTNTGQVDSLFLPELWASRSTKQSSDERIVTTQTKLEGFNIVRNILKNIIDLKRIFYRDSISYFSILLDDNNRKPICRLYFNGAQKYVTLFDKGEENKISIGKVQEIKNFEQRLKNIVMEYEKNNRT